MSSITSSETSAYSAVKNLQIVMNKIAVTLGVLRKYCHETAELDIDSIMPDVSIMVLNDLIYSVRCEVYVPGNMDLVREYRFDIATSPVTELGPPADNPPLPRAGSFPSGTRLRVVVAPKNPDDQTTIQWFERLGWSDCDHLNEPDDVETIPYGTFASAGFGVHRICRVNKAYDSPNSNTATGKEYSK